MKRLISLIITLTLITVISSSAYASDSGMGYAVNDLLESNYYNYNSENDDYYNSVSSALIDKIFSDRYINDSLPFWAWIDLDGDGLSEIIVDNNDGKKGVETVKCKMLENIGGKIIETKGDFTVYYWNLETLKADSLIIDSSNMFLSLASNGRYLIASTAGSNWEKYTLYGYFPHSIKMLSETYTLTYSGRELVKITVKDSFGNTRIISENDDTWFDFMTLDDVLCNLFPLVFSQTS